VQGATSLEGGQNCSCRGVPTGRWKIAVCSATQGQDRGRGLAVLSTSHAATIPPSSSAAPVPPTTCGLWERFGEEEADFRRKAARRRPELYGEAHERKRRERRVIERVGCGPELGGGWSNTGENESSFSLVPIVSHVKIQAMVTKVSPTSPNEIAQKQKIGRSIMCCYSLDRVISGPYWAGNARVYPLPPPSTSSQRPAPFGRGRVRIRIRICLLPFPSPSVQRKP
jgi:hypothetical protein